MIADILPAVLPQQCMDLVLRRNGSMVGADAPQVDQVAYGAVQHTAAFFAVLQRSTQYVCHIRRDENIRADCRLCRSVHLVDLGICNGVGKHLFQFLGTGKRRLHAVLGVFSVGTNHDVSPHEFLGILIDGIRCAVFCRCTFRRSSTRRLFCRDTARTSGQTKQPGKSGS